MRTSPSYTASYRLEVDEANLSVSQIVDAVSATGAQIKGLDVADSDRGRIVIDLTCVIPNIAARLKKFLMTLKVFIPLPWQTRPSWPTSAARSR